MDNSYLSVVDLNTAKKNVYSSPMQQQLLILQLCGGNYTESVYAKQVNPFLSSIRSENQ